MFDVFVWVSLLSLQFSKQLPYLNRWLSVFYVLGKAMYGLENMFQVSSLVVLYDININGNAECLSLGWKSVYGLVIKLYAFCNHLAYDQKLCILVEKKIRIPIQ